LKLKFPVAAISKETNFNKGTVSQYLKKKLEPSEKFIEAFYEKFGDSLRNVSRGIPKTSVSDNQILNDGGEQKYGKSIEEKMSLQAILNLTESNRQIAESNSSLARSNEELVSMVKKSTAYAQPKITVDDAAMRSDFLELIARIGTGEKVWKSVDEGTAILSKFVLVPNVDETKEGIHAGSGIRRKKLDS
jgi:hypothetical protein